MTLLLFMGVSILGVGMSMMTDAQGHMSSCPFMNGLGSLCQMNIFDHLSHWQAFFTALAPTNFNASLFLFLTLAIAALAFWRQSKPKNQSLPATIFYRQELPILFSPLRIAFAQGILHPKIYDVTAIG